MEWTMNSLAPSATISPDQEIPRYFEPGQRKRPVLGIVRSARPNAAARDIDRMVVPVMGSLVNLTMDAAEEWESIDRFLRCLTEGMADPPHKPVFISTWMVSLAPNLPIETFANRARAAINDLTRLPPGWDGYHGIAVLPGVAEHALRLLEEIGAHTQIVPDVVPLSNGGMQLEWYVGIDEVEVEIAPDCATVLHHERTSDGSTTEIRVDDSRDISQVAVIFRGLRR